VKITKEFKVGLLTVVSGAILYIGFNFLKGIDLFSNSNKYYAYYSNIDGLTVSNPVTLNGFAIGRVSDISIIQERNNMVEVEFDIKEYIKIGKSSKAELVTDILGSKSVVLHTIEEEELIPPGGTIEGIIEQSIFETILDTADPIKSTILKLNSLLNGFSGTKIKLDSLLVSFKKTADGINKNIDLNQNKLQKIIENLMQLTEDLGDEEHGIKPLVGNFKTFSDSLKVLELSKTVNNLNKTLVSLDETLKKVNSGDGSMAKFINNDSLYTNLNNTAADLDKLLIDLKENPNRYVHFSLFGRKDK